MLYTHAIYSCNIYYFFASRHYGTINLLSALTSEAVKSVLVNQSEEETWGVDSLDILLETWNVILGVLPLTFAQNSMCVYALSLLHNLTKCLFTTSNSKLHCDGCCICIFPHGLA